MQGRKGVIEDGKRADWETFKWLCSTVQHGGRVAEAIERNTMTWLLLLTGAWQVSLSRFSWESICTLCQCMYVYVCSLCIAICALHKMCILACARLSGCRNVGMIWLAGMFPSEFLTQSHRKAESIHITQILVLSPWRHLMEETRHLLMKTLI